VLVIIESRRDSSDLQSTLDHPGLQSSLLRR